MAHLLDHGGVIRDTQRAKGERGDPATGEVAWKIGKGAAGTHAVELNAQDSEGFKIFQKYSLNVTIPQEEKK